MENTNTRTIAFEETDEDEESLPLDPVMLTANDFNSWPIDA